MSQKLRILWALIVSRFDQVYFKIPRHIIRNSAGEMRFIGRLSKAYYVPRANGEPLRARRVEHVYYTTDPKLYEGSEIVDDIKWEVK